MAADAGDTTAEPMPLDLPPTPTSMPPRTPPAPAPADEKEEQTLPPESLESGSPGTADKGGKETSPLENPKFDESSEVRLPLPADDAAGDRKSLQGALICASDRSRWRGSGFSGYVRQHDWAQQMSICACGYHRCRWGGSSCAYARQHDRAHQMKFDDPHDHWRGRNCMDLREQRDDDHALLRDRYYWSVSPSYFSDSLFGNEYLYRNGHTSYAPRGYPSWKSPLDMINPYNHMGSLESYIDTACCSTKINFEKNYYPVGASLSNPEKWICFLNCILQCVVHTVPLVSKLLEDDHVDPCDSDEFCCYCSLKLHAGEVIKLSGDVLYPKKFVKLLELILPDFVRGQHQDAHEFLRCLLDKLDKASVAPRSPSERPSSIVKEVFGGRLRSQLHCPQCNHCSDTLEPFLDLSLEVIGMDTVTDALRSFTKVEVFEDFSCGKCKSRVNMEKHLKVEQAPEVLVIQLKRFQNLGSDISKIQGMVGYQLELDLNPFMSSPDKEPQKYDLYGVVEHLGVSSKGHYVCFIRSSQTDWFLFDDARVIKYSEACVLENKAYLLFYIKQGSSPWFSKFLKLTQKNILLPDPSKEFAEKGSNKAVFRDKESESESESGSERETESESDNDEIDSADHRIIETAEKNGTNPSFSGDLSEQLHGNADGGTLCDVPDKNESSSRLGEVLSGGTQEVTCLPGSSANKFCLEEHRKLHVCSPTVLLENNKNASPQGSHNIHESSQVTDAPPQGGSPQKDGNICSSPQSSHEQEDGCSRERSSLRNQMNGTSRLRRVGFNSDHDCGDLNHTISNDENKAMKRKKPPSEGGPMMKKGNVTTYQWMKRALWAARLKSNKRQRK